MPYNLADDRRPVDDLRVRDEAFFRQQGIELALRHRVREVDMQRGSLIALHEGTERVLAWDRLVVATGARPQLLTVPGLPEDRLLHFRTLEDLRRLKMRLDGMRRVCVVGAGPLGLELCEALRHRGVEVLLVDVQPLPLPGFPHGLREGVRDELLAQGVDLALGQRLLRATFTAAGAPIAVTAECLSTGAQHSHSCDVVLHAAGQRAATDLPGAASLERDAAGALVVDVGMRSSHPRVWAAGDCVTRRHAVPALPGEEECVWNPQAREARRGGRVAGWNAAGGEGGELRLELSPHPMALRCFNLEVARIGRLSPEESSSTITATPLSPVRGLLGMPLPELARDLKGGVRRTHLRASTVAHGMPGEGELDVWLEAERNGRLRGAAFLSRGAGAVQRLNVLAPLLGRGATVADLVALDLVYSPPFGPIEDPLLRAAIQLERTGA